MTDSKRFRPNLDIFGVPRKDPGWIYIIKNGELLKVGKTTNPRRRVFSEAKTWLPELKIIGVKPFWNIGSIERALHAGFAQFWHAGEWFRFPRDDDVTEDFREFHNDDRDWNSVDFIYWFNSSGFGEIASERYSQRLSLRQWQRLASSGG